MDAHAWIAVATLVAAAILFITKPIPIGVTALSIPVVLTVTGVLADPADALSGFGNRAVIAIGSIFVVGAGLQESGVATFLAQWLQRVAGRREVVLLVLVMAVTAALSAFMNNAAAVALLLPAVVALCRRALVQPSRLLIPLSYAAVLGGTVTLIGTAPHLLLSNHLQDWNEKGRAGAEAVLGTTLPVQALGVFDYAFVGIPIVIMGILYMATIGRRLLPQRVLEDRMREARLPEEVAQSYGLTQNLFQMRVVPESRLLGKTIAEAAIRSRYGLSVVMVVRPGPRGTHRYLQVKLDLVLQEDDRLYMEGEEVAAWEFAESELLQFGLAGPQAIENLLGRGMTLAEVSVPPRSTALGRTLREIRFRTRYGLGVLSLWRRGAAARKDAGGLPLEVGDVFLVSGPVGRVVELGRSRDYIVLTDQQNVEDVTRAPLAVGLLLVALLPPILGLAPISISALAAALLMVVTGCISGEGLRRAVDWKVLALIIGTIPLGLALEQQDVTARVADGLVAGVSAWGPSALIAALFLLTAAMAMLSTNAAAAVIVAPIATQAAVLEILSPQTALLAVAYGCSCAFMLPFAQWNLLVMAPGGYRARDYLRVGAGMSLVMAITVIVLLSLRG